MSEKKVKYLSVRQCAEQYGDQMVTPFFGRCREPIMAIHHAIRKGYIPYTWQNDVKFIREPDFLVWLAKYRAGEFKPGRKEPVWIEPEETATETKLSTANKA